MAVTIQGEFFGGEPAWSLSRRALLIYLESVARCSVRPDHIEAFVPFTRSKADKAAHTEIVKAGLWTAEPWAYGMHFYVIPNRFIKVSVDERKRERERDFARRIRQQIIDRDGYICGICGGDVEPTDVHVDHIIPITKGGTTRRENMRVAHRLCNVRKGARIDG